MKGALPNILLLGKHGQVGWELQRALAPLGCLSALGHAECDLADLVALRSVLRASRPDVIVNAAAYTAVDKAESEAALATRINGEAPAVLAQEAHSQGALLIHYSTDYVFAGDKLLPYDERDAPAPLSVYGRSKLAGEAAIAATGCRHLLFRTSWVFGAHGGNFAKTILRLAREREELKVVADQIGAPTPAALIADVTAHALVATLAERAAPGLYHLAASGATSWHGYAELVLDAARQRGAPLQLRPHALHAIATEDYPLPAPRPKNSRLDSARLEAAFNLQMPPWQNGVHRLIQEIVQP